MFFNSLRSLANLIIAFGKFKMLQQYYLLKQINSEIKYLITFSLTDCPDCWSNAKKSTPQNHWGIQDDEGSAIVSTITISSVSVKWENTENERGVIWAKILKSILPLQYIFNFPTLNHMITYNCKGKCKMQCRLFLRSKRVFYMSIQNLPSIYVGMI